MKDGDLEDAIRKLFEERRAETNEKAYKQWCDEVAAISTTYETLPKARWLIDQEFQPMRWLSHGLHILKLSSGSMGAPSDLERSPYLVPLLPYAVFQIGAELFLKGMWLCQFTDCRELSHKGHLEPVRREELAKKIKSLGHDLLKLIEANRQIAPYKSSPEIIRFLTVTEGVVRFFYYPIYETSKRDWASSRYPKRFYDDATQEGASDSLKEYPPTSHVIRLFEEAEKKVDDIWSLRKSLASKTQ